MLTGLDLAEAMASLSPDCDRECAREYFLIYEQGYIAAHLAREKDNKDRSEQDG